MAVTRANIFATNVYSLARPRRKSERRDQQSHAARQWRHRRARRRRRDGHRRSGRRRADSCRRGRPRGGQSACNAEAATAHRLQTRRGGTVRIRDRRRHVAHATCCHCSRRTPNAPGDHGSVDQAAALRQQAGPPHRYVAARRINTSWRASSSVAEPAGKKYVSYMFFPPRLSLSSVPLRPVSSLANRRRVCWARSGAGLANPAGCRRA